MRWLRRVMNLALAASLFLCAATGALWHRSMSTTDEIASEKTLAFGTQRRYLAATSFRGGLTLDISPDPLTGMMGRSTLHFIAVFLVSRAGFGAFRALTGIQVLLLQRVEPQPLAGRAAIDADVLEGHGLHWRVALGAIELPRLPRRVGRLGHICKYIGAV